MSDQLPDPELTRFLESEGLIEQDDSFDSQMLPGGVSSDIHLVSGSGKPIVVKRALAELKVEGTWRAPVERSAHEAAYLRVVGQLVPGFCPLVLAHDETSGYLAMEYFDPQAYPLWKTQLLAGAVEVETAARVGENLGKVHSRASKTPGLAEEFETTDAFRSLRLHPYLETLPAKHPQITAEVDRLILMLLSNRKTLVHGDVSPKNILVGNEGPVLLDAECAWWGDPAFDLGFCMNHLFLKSFLRPKKRQGLMLSVSAFIDAYVPHVSWEDADSVLERTAALLPALMLARVDGLSPVEYLDSDQRETVRDFALAMWGREGVSVEGIVGARLLEWRT